MQKMSKKLFVLLLLVAALMFVFAACDQKVTYTFMNGDVEVSSVSGNVGENVTLPENPEAPEGYYFVGWQDASGNSVTNKFTAGNKTYNAVFEKYIVITFVDGNAREEKLFKKGEAIVTPDPIGQEGAYFAGWFDSNDNAIPATATADGTYYAKYTTEGITVTFRWATGETTSETSTATGVPGEVIPFPNVKAWKEGEELIGWYDENGNKAPKEFTVQATYIAKFGSYTYNDTVSLLATNWNQHIYQTNDDSYPIDFLSTGLFGYYFNDTYDGYEIVPMMATGLTDVTAEYFDASTGRTFGYAYRITLNPDAKWETGEAINAYTYEYSLKQLLDPELINYRATDYMDGDLEILNARNYYYAGREEQVQGQSDKTQPIESYYLSADDACYFFGDAASLYYNGDYADYFKVEDAEGNIVDVYTEYFVPGAHITEELIELLLKVANNFGDSNPEAWYEFCFFDRLWPEFDWSEVGFKVVDEYTFDLVLDKSLTGFYLYYNLSGNWIVHEATYEACKSFEGDYYVTTYCTSVETTVSYGPYKLTNYQRDKSMIFERNENWFGYNLPQNEGLYKTTKITCQPIKESSTRKTMFLAGQIETYGLQADDFASLRNSPWAHVVPGDTIFFMILSGHEDIKNFETDTVNKWMMAQPKFRKAMSLAFDKEDFAAEVDPARSGAYGLIGDPYIWNPESGESYRDTDEAKQALCDFYQMTYGPDEIYKTLDEAVEAITGYDPVLAKQLFVEAFEEGLASGIYKEGQEVVIDYGSSETGSTFIASTLDSLNRRLASVLEGTGYVVRFFETGPFGNDWSEALRDGRSQSQLAGWQGSRMNPFSLTDLYVNPSRAYDANWFNAGVIKMTLDITVNGEPVTLSMSLLDWSNALNGAEVTVDGVVYNFGYGMVEDSTRLYILSRFEYEILSAGSYIPMLQDGGIHLLSKKLNYVTDEYNGLLGFGGLTYIIYNYTDTEWAEYVASQGGILDYT